jgi:SAM-dependent methyltransferase
MAAPDGETYTHGHHDSVLRSHRWRTVENSAAYLTDHLQPGVELLDVGCGPGTITLDMAARVAPGNVVGLDASADVVAAATTAAQDAGATNVELRVGDVYALDLPDDSFDVVHAHQVLQHLSDPVAALREMRRVCRPTGVVAARDAVYRSFSWYPVDPALRTWMDVYCGVHEANGGEPDAGTHLLTWARASGFTAVECRATAWCYATRDEVQWWSELWAERITKTALADRAVELGLATRDDLDELAAAWRRWGAHDDAWFALVNGEILARP